jgi:hypothetical protein
MPTRLRTPWLLLFPALLAAPAALTSPALSPSGGEGAGPAPAPPETPLKAAMEDIEDCLGRLRRALRDDEQPAEALAAVASMEEATLRAKLLVPPLADKAPEAERAALVRDYRKLMVELMASQLALEAELLDGDLAGARERFKEVRAFEDTGHERFTEDG